MSELNTKLTSETERADKIAFDNAKLMEKLEAISLERERILAERDQLKETWTTCNAAKLEGRHLQNLGVN